MANKFNPSQISAAFAGAWPSESPFIMNTNRTLDKNFRAGHGATMDINVPPYAEMSTGPALPPGLDYTSGVRPLTLHQYKVGFEGSMPELSLDLVDYTEEVIKPYVQSLAAQIEELALKDSMTAANQAVVVNVISGGARVAGLADVQKLRKAVNVIRANRSLGSRFGQINPLMLDEVTDLKDRFLPSDIAKSMWADAEIGQMGGAKWIANSNCAPHVAGSLVDESAGVRAYDIDTAASEGDSTLKIAATGSSTLTAGETINKGDVFTVAGCYTVDIYGNAGNALKAFIVTEDHEVTAAEATAGVFTVKVAPMYTNGTYGSKALCNVSALPAANAVVTKVLTAGKSYATGLVYDKDSVFVGQAKLKEMPGTDSWDEAQAPNGLMVRFYEGPDPRGGVAISRWDTMIGWTTARSQWSTALYLEL